MASEYQKYLAAQVLSEGNVVSYRLLSRALDVHNNIAKKMLFEFHCKQNSKQPGSVCATYLISGFQTVTLEPLSIAAPVEDEDTPMQSSPYMSSPPKPEEAQASEPQTQRAITLVNEEHLETVKETYTTISSIHVYSLGRGAVKNLEIVANVTQRIVAEYTQEDPLVKNKVYGVIQNPNVKRRSGARAPAIPLFTKAPPAPVPNRIPEVSESETKHVTTSDTTIAADKPYVNKEGAPERKKTAKPTNVKRESSDLFKSFAKTQPPRIKRENTDSSAASPAPSHSEASSFQHDVMMQDASEDDAGDEALIETKPESTTQRKTRLEREAKLRKMMEDEEVEEDEDEDNTKESMSSAAEEIGADDSMPIDRPEASAEQEEQPTVTVAGGRRRGRRKVMKKKTTKDAEGYLVTKEEPSWESFSEDEPPPSSKFKPLPPSSAKSKKGSGSKAGQGNIMSFFGKK